MSDRDETDSFQSTGGGDGSDQTDEPTTTDGSPSPQQKYCTSCGEIIKQKAEICPECGVRQPSPAGAGGTSNKDRTTAGIFALLLGGVGAHKFYLDDIGLGVLYLCFSWTFIPAIIGFIEGILYLTKSDAEFQEKYVD